MRVYRWAPEPESAAWLSPSDENGLVRMDAISCGRRAANTWTPIRVDIVDTDETGSSLGPVDVTSLGASLRVLSGRAVAALGEYLESFGELLPLECPGHTYFAYNVTCLIDALDEGEADVTYFPDTQRVMMVDRYVFKKEALADAHVFKLTRDPCGFILLTERAVERLTSSGCSGINVELVWED